MPTVHIVSHTHWDREWYLTYEQFRLRLVGLIDRLLDLMESHPDFEYFHLDGQTIVLEDYLQLRPHQEPRLRKLIAEGRILVGPWYDMPDEFLVSGESIVRNLALGHRIAAAYGTPMPVGYLPDLFGHVGQMPQILALFGLDNAILWRGFGGPRAEYWWEAPDGSRLLMLHLPPEGYCNATRVHLNPDLMVERTRRAIEHETARTVAGEVLLMNGVDHVEPHPVIPELARRLTSTLGYPVSHSTLPAYADAVRRAVAEAGVGESLEVVRGELRGGEDYANLLPGVFSARVYLKQANARVQTLLEKRAEPLASFAWRRGAAYPAGELRYAWTTLLQNHPHDSICGCSIDAVHEENMTRFARAEQVARAVVDQAASAIAATVAAAPDGALRLVAINTTASPFNGVLQGTIELPYESDEPRRQIDETALDRPVTFWPRDAQILSIRTADGSTMPFQVLQEEDSRPMVMSRYETPWILRSRRLTVVWPGKVPACGYATFDVDVASDAARESPAIGAAREVARDFSPAIGAPGPQDAAGFAGLKSRATSENEHVRLAVNDDGTVDIVDKKTGTRYERCGELEDVADVGDEYNYSPPAHDRRVTSRDARHVRITRVHDGPVRTTFRIELNLALPASATADRSGRSDEMIETPVVLTVSLDADSPRVEWTVALDNHSKDHRLRILFPTGASVDTVRAETAFGVVTRPARKPTPPESRWEVPVSYAPTGSFTEAGSDTAGAILFGDGLAEYEALPDEAGHISRLGLTLLRSVGSLSRDDLVLRPSGHAGPGLATPGAQCLGRHSFRLAFEPRRDPPTSAALFSRAGSFVAPPLVVPATGLAADTGTTGTFLEIDHADRVVLSACHKSEDGNRLLVRLFNPDPEPAPVRINLPDGARQPQLVDFLERRVEDARLDQGSAVLTLGPHKIVTLHL